ncbi:unnamed protein product [Amaranthus hypochondriacus]
MGVPKFIFMFGFIILLIQLEMGGASDPYPLFNIMLEGIKHNSLQCVGYGEQCGPLYWCCGTCYCDYVYSAGRLECTPPAFATWCG